jgi:hypothetical protein
MTSALACVMCMVDPQTTSMVVPMAQATVIALPIFFRGRIAAAVKRAVRGRAESEPSSADGENGDTRDDDPPDEPEPPGALRP